MGGRSIWEYDIDIDAGRTSRNLFLTLHLSLYHHQPIPFLPYELFYYIREA